jgi:hypothetical protein
MLCPPLRPLNRRPNVPNLPDPHRARPSRAAGSFFDVLRTLRIAAVDACTGKKRTFATQALIKTRPSNPASYLRR